MAGAALTATLDDTQVQAALRRVGALVRNPGPLLRQIGAGLVAAADARFSSQTDPWGRAWAPLSPAYAAMKRNTHILQESTALVRSLHFVVGDRQVAYGSNLIYAAIHQFGGTIKPKNARALVFRLGDRLVHAHSVFIPARAYLGIGPAEIEAIHLATQIQMTKVWRG
jgi:phage virion morphogenesis protein